MEIYQRVGIIKIFKANVLQEMLEAGKMEPRDIELI
jgi:hypothetical protein